eukprot:457331_1
MLRWLFFHIILVSAHHQSDQMPKKEPASFCGCNVVKNNYEEPFSAPGTNCAYYCRNTYFSKHMTKEIRVVSIFNNEDNGNIVLMFCNNTTTSLTKPVILYLLSYNTIHWVIGR